jgi:hypothetical protein
MRWTLGFAWLSMGCFGEAAGTSSTTADDATESSTSMSAGTSSMSEPTDTNDTSTTSVTAAVTSADTSSSSGDDTTTGDQCGAGSAPNPPPPPPGWSGPVFASVPAQEPRACPDGAKQVALGLVVPPSVDECECACDAPFEELCHPFFAAGEGCPHDVPVNTVIDDPCEVLFDDPSGFTGNASGVSCDAEPRMPQGDVVRVCAVDPVDGPCIDELAGFGGPCIFREGNHPCPDPLVRVDAGREATCNPCAPCQLDTHCGDASLQVFAGNECEGKPLLEFSDDSCYEIAGAGSIRAVPSSPLVCPDTGLTLAELTMCCGGPG